MKNSIIALSVVAVMGITSCVKKPVEPEIIVDPAPMNEVHFMFHNHFGSNDLELGTGTYTTSQGEEITIDIFNYWITNIRLVRADGTEFTEEESYRLLRGDKAASHHFHVQNVPEGIYTGVKFIIGVDVARNTSGAQTGALDPTVNGDMFWEWNTGYIQAKMEGTSPQSIVANNKFTYHIAGVQPGYETPREVTLSFGEDLQVGSQAGSIHVKTDAANWFGPVNAIKISETPNSVHGGAMAVKVADNLPGMFSVTKVENE